ncbi:MAG: NAD(P)-dependent oxidoreductase, partial [Acidobacteriota bacterium]
SWSIVPRGGIVDEETLLDMLDSGHLAGAALDVFAEEPPTDWRLAGHDNVVATPHLGAQTEEAQVRISTQTAQMVVAALEGSLAVTAVNLPFRPAGAQGEPYLRLAEKLGLLASTLADGAPDRLDVVFHGLDDGLHVPVTVAAIKGALVRSLGVGVNYVNAESVARERGLDVRRSVTERAAGYPNLLEVRLEAGGKTVSTVGTLFHGQEARVVGVAGYNLEFRPKGELLIVQNRDVPGVVGKLGTLLGAAGVNIAEIHLARRAGNDDSVEAGALAVVRLDQALDVEVVALVQAMDEVVRADALDIGDP